MTLLIDGYNLLNAVGITGRGSKGTSLHRSRSALLNFLAEALGPDETAATTVVFDSAGAPPGLPKAVEHRGIAVRFAAGYPDADTLIEELVQANSAPRQLTVVSSDHALHRAARRRKATAVDSDVWFRDLLDRRARREAKPLPPARPPVPLSEEEIAGWLEEFGGQQALDKLAASEFLADVPAAEPDELPTESPGPPPDKLTADEAAEIGNPFPPGYAEDLFEDSGLDDPQDGSLPD